ncbi:MAG: carbonic anhydrase [Acetobacteraceae bacterium]|nr:carbonic anhydrase [Acetobacteraceae bacterium]
MEALLEGYRRFRANGWPERRKLFEALAAHGQHPRALVLGCIDSRVDPAMIFDAAPGEILVVRNIANLIPPYAPDRAYHGTSAALEFGARVLGVSDIIVLGHGMCGGVRTLLEGAPEEARDFIAGWMAMARPARERVGACDDPAERQRRCEYEVIKLSLANLMTFPWIAERVAHKELTLHGAWFAIHTGTLAVLQPDGSFHRA